MICIFCGEEKKASEEHIIPENIGGQIIIRTVCKDCNSRFGSEVDAVLNRHRHIYDSYWRQADQANVPKLKFHFIKAHFEDAQGRKIKLPKNNQDRRTVPTQTSPNSYVIDQNDSQFVEGQIRKIAKRQRIGKRTVNRKIRDFQRVQQTAKPGDIYEDPIFDLKIKFNVTQSTRTTVMKAGTPHRFLAKACVELAYALQITDRIGNLDLLKIHALEGTELDKLKVHEENRSNEEQPFHLLQFCSGQFHVHFFAKYATSIEIDWLGEPDDILLAHDITSGEIYHCIPDGDNMVIGTETVSLKLC